MKKEIFNANTARNISIENVLKDMGHLPKRVNGYNLWYNSPLRTENVPSFKVNSNLNRWFDFGASTGGNVIDLLINMFGFECTEALKYLSKYASSDTFSFAQPVIEDKPQILAIKPIKHPAIREYLASRKIPKEIYELYCEEIHYKANGKKYFGVGFSNDANGYEIRSPYFKGCLQAKDITTIKGKYHRLIIYEGFMDFLSHMTIKNQPHDVNTTIIILNSVANISKLISKLSEKCCQIETYLDNDPAGDKATDAIFQYAHWGMYDGRIVYKEYKDLNEYLINHLK